ncbi:MAG: pyridine nucleotide-disulfide oxidoreductase [Pseudonocardia sp. SCN 72-86]|nr:MAG: pyridine nucleotide-disulfide oxidoreductase [Pseudonocardia sp. SCN 72-86]
MSRPARPGPVVVVVGAGQAGVQTADSLRAGGYTGPVVLLGDEPGLPYQRPPLSKDFIAAGGDPRPLPLRGERFFADRDIDHRPGAVVTAVDRARRTVTLASGVEIGYATLVLATGAEPRPLSGPRLAGVHTLRTLADARSLRAALERAHAVVVVGAGFIGLEFAAVARARGIDVTVLESADRVLARAVSAETGRHLLDVHRGLGADVRPGTGLARLEECGGVVRAGVDTSGVRHRADLVVAGIGVRPRDGLAQACGLAVDDGILVDGDLRTSDPSVLAVGDCARFPAGPTGALRRLESVQNATDQARHAAAVMLGTAIASYAAVPWFWSVQGPVTLQIAGLADPDDEAVVSGDPAGGRFSVLRLREGRLVAVESLNRPADHVVARRLLARPDRPTRGELAESGFGRT